LRDDPSVEFRLLGPLEVRAGDRPIPLEAPKLRALLAILLLRANEPVARDVLIEELWAARPPATAAKIIKTYVSQLRRFLGPETIVTVPAGYRFRADPGSIDLRRFEQLVAEARVLGPSAAVEMLREALALWRGPPLADFSYEPWAQLEIERLAELRLEAVEARIDAELTLKGSGLVPELEHLVAENPLRERLRAQLMLALYRSGRQADALAVYRDTRQALVETFGIEPGPALRQLERAILEQEASLDATSAEPASSSAGRSTATLSGGSSSFIGRRRELREVRALLGRPDVQLLTLTGAAGSGKTRLALEAVGGLDDAPDAILVELAPVTDAGLVATTMADALGLGERPGRTSTDVLLDHLRHRRSLLVLDNFEQVLHAAPTLTTLLDGAPGVTLLVTSRTPLGLVDEQLYPVPPLGLPDLSGPRTPARLRRTEAIRLFVDRAREASPGFRLTEANADAVAELCVRLDGLPLALELAAARSNLLSPRALLDRLGDRLDLLRAQPGSGLAERHQTLRAAIEWSDQLLEPGLQALFRNLAVFVGGFTLDGAEAVAGEDGVNVLDGLQSLLASNLLTTRRTVGGEPRLGMLETIREYALERPTAVGDAEAVHRRHAGFYSTLAVEAESALLGPDQRAWLDRLDDERDNLRAAIDWARDSGDAEVGLRIAVPLWRFWQMRNHALEARRRIEELLAIGRASPVTTADGQWALATLAYFFGDHETVRRALTASMPVHRRRGNHRHLASALGILSASALATGDLDEACRLAQEELEAARVCADSMAESYALAHLGWALASRGQLDDAERAVDEALRLASKVGNVRSVAQWRIAVSGVAVLRGDHARARLLLETSLADLRGLDDAWGVAQVLSNLAHLALAEDDYETARTFLAESVAFDRGNDYREARVANDLELTAWLADVRGRLARAVTIYAGAASLRDAVGLLPCEFWWPDPRPRIAYLRERIGDVEFEQAWAHGWEMTALEAIDEAIAETSESVHVEAGVA
jgi:predicted ATPase/DNA-binding SARP family transcriptional activator/Flp pilus assembly protein TadD